jgi:hypothetical protein
MQSTNVTRLLQATSFKYRQHHSKCARALSSAPSMRRKDARCDGGALGTCCFACGGWLPLRGHLAVGLRHGGENPELAAVLVSRVLLSGGARACRACGRLIARVLQGGRGSSIHSKQIAQLKKILGIFADDPSAVGGEQQRKRNHIAGRPIDAVNLGASTAHTLRERREL